MNDLDIESSLIGKYDFIQRTVYCPTEKMIK